MEEKPETSGQFSIFYGNEKPLTPGKRSISVQMEKLSIFRFLLDHVKSQSSGREGRVAKRKIDCSSLDLWQKYKIWANGTKEAKDYRVSYRIHSQRLHELAELTNSEKLDLYYALDIKIPKPQRQKIVDEFGVDISEEGVVTGTHLLEHWDLVHPDSEREDENGDVTDSPEKRRKSEEKWSRFTEKDDGMMWEFVLSQIQEFPDEQFLNGKKIWEEFQKDYKSKGASTKRASQTYSQRYHRILAPNLHIMPFDIETKAAIYENTKITVPEEFRDQLISKTGVIIDEHGTVTQYPEKPKNLVLQSAPIESLIGFTSANRISTLIHPKNMDTKTWTNREDKQIWAYVLLKMRNEKNKPIRAKNKLNGWMFWREFVKDHKTERTWQALCQHFNEDLKDNIMETNFPISTKVQLLFICNTVLDEDDKRIIEPMCTKLVLNNKGGINYAAGHGFRVGRPIFRPDCSNSQEDSDEDPESSADNQIIMENLKKIMEDAGKAEKLKRNQELVDEDYEVSNSAKKSRSTKKYAPTNGNLTVDNIGEFMQKIKDNFVSERKSRERRTPAKYRNGDYGELQPPKKRYRKDENDEETKRKVAEILKMLHNEQEPENEEIEEDEDNDFSNFAPMSLEDLAENAKNLAENLNLAPISMARVKNEPLDDMEGYGLPPELKEEKSIPISSSSEFEKVDDAASKPEIDYAFSRIEHEIRSFARTLKSGAPNLSVLEKEHYLKEIERLTSLFRDNSKDAVI